MELDAKSRQAKVSYNYSEQDLKSATDKLLEAAVLYDRNMPGIIIIIITIIIINNNDNRSSTIGSF